MNFLFVKGLLHDFASLLKTCMVPLSLDPGTYHYKKKTDQLSGAFQVIGMAPEGPYFHTFPKNSYGSSMALPMLWKSPES